MSEPITVVYLAGKGRSGSTLLTMALGQLDGWVAGGEARFTWRRGVVENRRCGCGEPFADCPYWQQVLAGLEQPEIASLEQVDTVLDAHDQLFRWPAMAGLIGRPGHDTDARAVWSRAQGDLYRSMARAADASVVVDSSKWPADPGVLGLVAGIRPVVVHLVRDPRAVAWSWQRTKVHRDLIEPREMDTYRPSYSAVSWTARNAVGELAASRARTPRLLVRYEDFVADPATTLTRIARFADSDATVDDVVDGHELRAGTNHAVAGNPDRFTTGTVTVRADDEWADALPAGTRRTVTALTAPLLGRYGYGRRAASSASTSGPTS